MGRKWWEKPGTRQRQKKIRCPFSGMNDTWETINSLCFEDLFHQNLLSCHLHNLLEIPSIVLKLIFEISFLCTFSTSAIYSMTCHPNHFFVCLFLNFLKFIWILQRDGPSLLWSQNVNVCLLIWFLGLECCTRVGEDAVYIPHLFWTI